MRRIARHIPLYVVFAVILAGCEPGIPKDALQLSPESLKDRQLQTRRFETRDEAKLLSASALLLQDLGLETPGLKLTILEAFRRKLQRLLGDAGLAPRQDDCEHDVQRDVPRYSPHGRASLRNATCGTRNRAPFGPCRT